MANLSLEVSNINLYSFEYPDNFLSEIFITSSSILLFLSLSPFPLNLKVILK